jgi:hypothetical protein
MCRLADNIKVGLEEIGREGVGWITLTQEEAISRVIRTVLNCSSVTGEYFLTTGTTISFSRTVFCTDFATFDRCYVISEFLTDVVLRMQVGINIR